MPKEAWVLMLAGGENKQGATDLEILAARIAESRPGIPVSGAVLGGKPGLLPIIRRLQRSGCDDFVLVPLWYALPEGGTADLDRQFLNSQRLRPDIQLRLGPPLRLDGDLVSQIGESAGAARPINEVEQAPPPATRRARRRRVPPPPYQRLALVCTGYTCLGRGSMELSQRLTALLVEEKVAGVRVARTNCLGPCTSGPVMHVATDGTWYGGVAVEDARGIAVEHLADGVPCADLRIGKV